MSLVLGIDTGGTYTDAVIINEQSNEVIAKAKAITTHFQLELGISEALKKVLTVSRLEHQQIALVSVSTTLATNAVVEGVGNKIAAVLIGMQKAKAVTETLKKSLASDALIHLSGGHDSQGNALEPLDLNPLESYLNIKPELSAIALCSFFSVRNPEHELAAKAFITSRTSLAVTSSHELATDLDAPKRALTTVLNARLIGLLSDFITAVENSLKSFKISAPLMIVKGDGSLITANEAKVRPIETIYSGPAASLVGACYLAKVDNAVIADIGGTTTDIAILHGGQPRLNPQGVKIGGWRTMVKAVDMHTFGLGGDSEISVEFEGLDANLVLGPKRVTPLSLLALEHKESLLRDLEKQLNADFKTDYDGYFVLLSPHASSADSIEQSLFSSIGNQAVPLRNLIQRRRDRVLIHKLVAQKHLSLAALTPSDAAHVLGLHTAWDTEVAHKACELFAQKRDKRGEPISADAPSLAKWIYQQVIKQSANLLLDTLLEADGFSSGSGHELIKSALKNHSRLTKLRLELNYPLLGLGASAGIYYPEVGQYLKTQTIIPEHADVANAVGAVMGLVRVEQEIRVSAVSQDLLRVHHLTGSQDFNELQAALEFAKREALEGAKQKALSAGARDLEYSLDIQESKPKIGDESLFLEARVCAKAYGRPRFA